VAVAVSVVIVGLIHFTAENSDIAIPLAVASFTRRQKSESRPGHALLVHCFSCEMTLRRPMEKSSPEGYISGRRQKAHGQSIPRNRNPHHGESGAHRPHADEIVRDALAHTGDVLPWRNSVKPLPDAMTKAELIAEMEGIAARSAARPAADQRTLTVFSRLMPPDSCTAPFQPPVN
jgi:hypothetical protein